MSFDAGTVLAVIFDLDDTLYPERDYVRSGFRAVSSRIADMTKAQAQPCGSPVEAVGVERMLNAAFDAGDHSHVFNTVLEQVGIPVTDQLIAELVGQYRCHVPALALDDSVRILLEDLKKQFKLGLITDGYLPAQRLKVTALGLERFFDHMIFTEALGRQFWKPSPVAFEQMARALDAPPHRCVYVADNAAKDFIAPVKLSWQTIHIRPPGGVHAVNDPPHGGRADVTIEHIEALRQMLLDESPPPVSS